MPDWLITSPGLTRLPLYLNPPFSSLSSSPVPSQPTVHISCHALAQALVGALLPPLSQALSPPEVHQSPAPT